MTPADALVVNHQVHLAGSTTGVVGHTVGYIGTREGCVTEETDDDRLRARQAETLDARFVGYMSERPGSVVDHDGSGLFDASGTRTVSGVRAELDANAGAVVTSVVSVRRADGEAMRLQTRRDFERLLRSEWAPAMARAMGVPEQDVRWVAAFHLNSDASYHAHVITWDASGRFDRLLDRARMEEARRELADAALTPVRETLGRERTLARDEAVLAARTLDGDALAKEVHLPGTGSLEVAWLRRGHADVAAALDRAVGRAMDKDPALAGAVGRHREAVRAMAELKGLEGPARERYVAAGPSRPLSSAICADGLPVPPDGSGEGGVLVHGPSHGAGRAPPPTSAVPAPEPCDLERARPGRWTSLRVRLRQAFWRPVRLVAGEGALASERLAHGCQGRIGKLASRLLHASAVEEAVEAARGVPVMTWAW